MLWDLTDQEYRPIGFRRISYGDWYLDGPSRPGKALVRQWPYPEAHLAQYLILEKIN